MRFLYQTHVMSTKLIYPHCYCQPITMKDRWMQTPADLTKYFTLDRNRMPYRGALIAKRSKMYWISCALWRSKAMRAILSEWKTAFPDRSSTPPSAISNNALCRLSPVVKLKAGYIGHLCRTPLVTREGGEIWLWVLLRPRVWLWLFEALHSITKWCISQQPTPQYVPVDRVDGCANF